MSIAVKTKFLVIFLFVAGLGVIGFVGAYRARRVGPVTGQRVVKPAVVRCASLAEASHTLTESFYGLIEPKTRVDMAFQIAGRISQLGRDKDHPLRENQVIEKGDVIARLEPLRYEAAVEQARASMATAKAQMATASADIAQVNAELQDAKSDLRRLWRLQNRQATTEREVEKADLSVKLAQARLDAASAKLSSAQAAYRSARAASTMANVDLQDTVLRAPVTATVAVIPIEVGHMIGPGQTVATLMELDTVKLVVGVVERKVPLLREGQKVMVDILAISSQSNLLSASRDLRRPREGVITMVPPAADDRSGLFTVEIDLPNEDGLLNPGMIGKAVVTITQQRAVAIPASAAVRSGDRAWVFFVDPVYRTGLNLGPVGQATIEVPATVARRVWLEPVVFGKESYLVRDLPEQFDQLIVEGHTRLRDGQIVKIIDLQPAASTAAQLQ